MEEKEEMISGCRTLCKKKPPTLLFENVRFGYNDIDVLKNCSFDIKPGERVALVGGSGNGKSTIVKVFFKLFQTFRKLVIFFKSRQLSVRNI